jgi:long-chain acyl-CoA synthetase
MYDSYVPDCDPSVGEPVVNVCDYLLKGKTASSPALLTSQGQHTYAELQLITRNVAAFLVKTGGRKGDRVILLADSSFFWVAAYLGILQAGLVCVPLAAKSSPEDVQYILTATDPRFVFVQSKYTAKLLDQLGTVPLITDEPTPDLPDGIFTVSLACLESAESGGESRLPDVFLDDLATLMFTSGSTGRPRGVMVSTRNIIANTDSIIQYLSLTARDRIMAVLPFHYCFGTSLLHTHLRVGGSVVIDPRFMYPENVLQRMHETACTGFAGVPSHFQILLRKSNLARMSFPHLRYVQQAGGQLAPSFIKELQQALPGKQIFIMYGQTEATARLSYLPPDLLDRKLGSVGKGIPGVTLSVLDDLDRPVPPGETGEIVAQGENIARGYWKDDQETDRCFRNGRLYTGDLATIDAEGFIYIVDRAKDFLKCGGKRVSCRHLEDILLEYGDLVEAAVVGIPDEVLGEAAVAYVVFRNPEFRPSEEQLMRYCRERMPLHFVPKQFVILDSLPKSSSGKVLKPLLRTQLTSAR